jgi:predicted dehydrogenase
MLKIGVLGAGHLGKIHIQLLKENSNVFDLIGFYDQNTETAQLVSEKYNIPSFPNAIELIQAVDAVLIVTPTNQHFEAALSALENGKHLFLEKPMVESSSEALRLLEVAKDKHLHTQVGFVERFNPAFLAAAPLLQKVKTIDSVRHAIFNPRGMDVSVVLDLMIHDIDICLSLIPSKIIEIKATGSAVIGQSIDTAIAELIFENGAQARLSVSRVHQENKRLSYFASNDSVVKVDFLEKKSSTFSFSPVLNSALKPNEMEHVIKSLEMTPIVVNPSNALLSELLSFEDSIRSNEPSLLGLKDGAKALEVAELIMAAINEKKLYA